jgi:hypothetical protein
MAGRHPRYLHARTDLRTAQRLLEIREEQGFMRFLDTAQREVEAAIVEIDRAAVLDRRDLEDHPRVDTSLNRTGRFERILALLRAARADISEEEDNPAARGWRNAAFRHIDAAIGSVGEAARFRRVEGGYRPGGGVYGRHPRYLHARSDLRIAQYLLRVTEEPNVTRHLRVAEREVEAAIGEIDNAAVLDRRDMDDHPRADTNLDRRGRFSKIVALLRSARADIAGEEDNPSARGWRNIAFRHIDDALDSVRRAAIDLRMDRELGF